MRRLEDEFANLVPLRRLPGVDVLPADLDAASQAVDIGDHVRPRRKPTGLGTPDADVDQVGGLGVGGRTSRRRAR